MSRFSLSNARKKIDQADLGMCDIFANSALDQRGNQAVEINDTVRGNLNSAPVELYIEMARFIDFSKLNENNKKTTQQALAGFIALRTEAVAEVGIVKKAEGAKDSYRHDRHLAVIKNNSDKVLSISSDYNKASIAKDAFDQWLKMSVKEQNKFLNGSIGIIHRAVERLRPQYGQKPTYPKPLFEKN